MKNRKTIKIEDINGQSYNIDTQKIMCAAQHCIQENYAKGAALSNPELSKAELQILLGHYPHEVFYALWLDSKHKIIEHGELFRGTIDSSVVHPREVVKEALRHNAAAVIFAHNHPSGVSTPSSADKSITQTLVQALSLVGVRVLDHIIVGSDTTSLAELGLLS